MTSVWRQTHIPLSALARKTGSDVHHIAEVLAGNRFPSRRFTDRYARACGADPCMLLRIWEDENERRRHSVHPGDDAHRQPEIPQGQHPF